MVDKNYNPLNPFVGQVQKFLDEKKVPKEQVVPFLMSLGYRGLAGAVASRMRLDQASEGLKAIQQSQNQAPPAPPNVMQENEQKVQQMQQQIQQAMAARRPQMPPQQAQPPGMAGGGIVAFQTGGVTAGDVFDWDSWNTEYNEARRVGNTTRMEQLKAIAKKIFPNFSEMLSDPKKLKEGLKSLVPESGGTVSKNVGRYYKYGAPALSSLNVMRADPALLAEEYGYNPRSLAGQLGAQTQAYFGDLIENASFGLLGGNEKLNRAIERENKINNDRMKTLLGEEGDKIAQNYMAIVREFGPNSPEAEKFRADYRDAMNRAAPEDEDALAQYMAQSATGGQGAGGRQGAAGGRGAGGGPRLPSVSTTAQETKTLSDLRQRLKGMEDVSKPEAREAAIDREIAARMKRYTDMGIMKPFDDAKANVQGRLKELEGIKDKNFYKAMAMMGFTMAGTRGSFFQALAAGGAAGLSAYETFEDKRQTTLDKLQSRMSEIDMGIANLKERAGSAAEARVDKLESERSRVQDQITSLQSAQETLAQTQSFQLAMSDRQIAAQLALADRQIAADAARDNSRYGGLGKEIEQEISRLRPIAQGTTIPKPSEQVREAARKRIEQLYDERERATQVGSGSYQSAELKALATQNPYDLYRQTGDEGQGSTGSWGSLTIR
jgi:hypothetical protein